MQVGMMLAGVMILASDIFLAFFAGLLMVPACRYQAGYGKAATASATWFPGSLDGGATSTGLIERQYRLQHLLGKEPHHRHRDAVAGQVVGLVVVFGQHIAVGQTHEASRLPA